MDLIFIYGPHSRTPRIAALAACIAVTGVARQAIAQSAPAEVPAKEAKETKEKEAPEVTVRGKGSSAQRMVRSAEAVTVVDLRRAKEQTADMGEVLARTQGVSVIRDGGLGSNTRFALNGLIDEQVRIFLDGVPLASAGYPFGISNVPVNLVERVEVYRGVVPLRFGADALGGAVNLVTDSTFAPRLAASYQTGSNGIYRLSLDGRTRDANTGFVFAATAFLDRAKNNYDVDVNVTDATGKEIPVRVPRFHDGYFALGGAVEAGVVDRPWARRLTARMFATGFDKDIQSNLLMTASPYGEVTHAERVYGGTLRYEQPLVRNVELEALANYSRRFIHFVDVSDRIYDWFGRRIGQNSAERGEVDNRPRNQAFWQDTVFGRATVTWTVAKEHVLRFSTAPTFTSRSGEERETAAGAADPQAIPRRLFAMNSGVEYESNFLGGRLQNIALVKDYLYGTQSKSAVGTDVSVNHHALGAGDAIRYRVSESLYAKASYEFATRLPSADEVFGNGALIGANPALEPETSHNVNVGPHIELRRTRVGDVVVDASAFLRETDKLITVTAEALGTSYKNVYSARSLGVEAGGVWTLPGRFLIVDGAVTYNDLRNTSNQEPFKAQNGDRIPSRPWLFGSWGARFRFKGLPGPNDTVEPFYMGRYVHSFFRAWESLGVGKDVVDAQTTHVAGVTWSVFAGDTRVSSTFEIDNLTDARVFDTFGAQRPGRQFFIKVSAEMR